MKPVHVAIPPNPDADLDAASDLEFFGGTIELDAAAAQMAKTLASNDAKGVIAELAKLSRVAYDQVRKVKAESLGIRESTLDAEVAKARGDDDGAINGNGQPFEIKAPEPWHDPVDGARLLDDLAATFRRFVILPEHGEIIAALWSLHTYAFALSHITPILIIASPDKGCGKTTMRDVLAGVVRSALSTDGISAAALFRVIEKWRPTVLLDDFDSWGRENDELRGVLNTGYRRGGVYVRCVGDDSEPRGFITFAPKAINLIGRLHPTLHDRALVITMRRKLRGEAVVSLHDFDGEELRRQCARWVADNAEYIRTRCPQMPEGLFNRQADNWRPLFALADTAGGDWPERARQAAQAAINTDTDNESMGVMLLADIRATLEAKGLDRITTESLLEVLTGMEERPWVEFSHGKPMTARHVARLLKPFGVLPGTIRMPSGGTAKGYHLSAFADAFARYLMDSSVTPSQTCKTRHFCDSASVTNNSSVTDTKRHEQLENKHCDAVTDTEPPGDIEEEAF